MRKRKSGSRVLSGDFSARHWSELRGHVDTVSPDAGISGWLCDLANPLERQRLALVVRDRVIAECETNLPRFDIASHLNDYRCTPGFCFTPETFFEFCQLDAALHGETVEVRVMNKPVVLPSSEPMPTVLACAEYAVAVARKDSLTDRASLFADLPAALENLHRASRALTRLPFRPTSEEMRGHIEVVSWIGSGLMLFAGWVRTSEPIEYPALVVQAEKIPCGVAMVAYPRQDLPEDAHAFLGVLRTSWRPASPHTEFFLSYGVDKPAYLRSVRPLRMLKPEELSILLDGVIAATRTPGRALEIRRLIESINDWTSFKTQQGQCSLAIDTALWVPGFGVFVEGWMLSPLKRLDTMFVRLGSNVLALDPGSLYFKPRQDLVSVFPRCADLVETAGFVAVLRGDLHEADLHSPMVKVVHSDGSSVCFNVDAIVLRPCDSEAAVARLETLYPRLHCEPFFRAFSEAFQNAVAARLRGFAPITIEQSDKGLIVSLPSDPSDAAMALEQLDWNLQTISDSFGIALLVGPSYSRRLVMDWLSHLKSSTGRPVSLIRVENLEYALHILPLILATLRMRRFVFVESNTIISRTGWTAVSEMLAGAEETLTIFSTESDAAEAAIALDCFGWTSERVSQWLANAPVLETTSDAYGEILRIAVVYRIHPEAIRRFRPRERSIFIQQVDRAISAHHRQTAG